MLPGADRGDTLGRVAKRNTIKVGEKRARGRKEPKTLSPLDPRAGKAANLAAKAAAEAVFHERPVDDKGNPVDGAKTAWQMMADTLRKCLSATTETGAASAVAFSAVRMMMEYTYGKPVQRVEVAGSVEVDLALVNKVSATRQAVLKKQLEA